MNPWSFVALCNDGTVVAGGDSDNYDQGGDPSAVKSELAGCNVSTIASAEESHVALCQDGSVVAWGWRVGQKRITYAHCNVTAIFANRQAYALLCSNHTVVAFGWTMYGGDTSKVELALSSGIRTIFSHPKGGSFVAIKDSALDQQPPGCTIWTYSRGHYALLLDDRGTAKGQCREGFRCLCV